MIGSRFRFGLATQSHNRSRSILCRSMASQAGDETIDPNSVQTIGGDVPMHATSPQPGLKELSDGEKRTADILLEQQKMSWAQFNARREYEFRVTLTIWSGLAAAVAGSLTFERFAGLFYGEHILLGAAALLTATHGYWCYGVHQAQAKDRAVALSFEAALNQLTGFRFDSLVQVTLRRGIRRRWLLQWTLVVQFAITVLLVCTLIAVNWNRVGVAEPTHRDLEKEKLRLEIRALEKSPPSK
jgi:hypothetical protein